MPNMILKLNSYSNDNSFFPMLQMSCSVFYSDSTPALGD